MNVKRGFDILKSRFKDIGIKSSLKFNFLPTLVHCCCVLYNILLASKDWTLDQILEDCYLPLIDENDLPYRDEEKKIQYPRSMGIVSEERALPEGKMTRGDLLDYLVHIQNTDYIARHTRRPRP